MSYLRPSRQTPPLGSRWRTFPQARPLLALSVAWAVGACHYDFSVHRTEQECSDGIDNDSDGQTDCHDSDCSQTAYCSSEAVCDNNVDDDADGLTDCDDPDCADACGESLCDDNLDNDDDGQTDCDDPDCSNAAVCLGEHSCNNDGVCEPPYEDRRWCGDCLPECNLLDGQRYEYIASALTIPYSADEAQAMGVDLDGDGDIDNGLGALLGLASQDDNQQNNENIARGIENGTYMMLLRLLVDQWPDDDVVTVQIFDGDLDPTHDATEDNLSGEGHALISPSAPKQQKMCGSLSAPHLVAGPGEIRLPLPLFHKVVYVTTTAAWLVTGNDGTASATGLQDVIIAGGWTQDTIDYEIIPELAIYLSDRYKDEDPSSDFYQTVHDQLDGHCTTLMPGCSDVVNGEGECTVWDGDPSHPIITATEIRCSLLSTYVRPTVDLDGDGEADIFPVGVRASFIPITIDN